MAKSDAFDYGKLPPTDPHATPLIESRKISHIPRMSLQAQIIRALHEKMRELYLDNNFSGAAIVADEIMHEWNRCPGDLRPIEFPYQGAAVFAILRSIYSEISTCLRRIERIEKGKSEESVDEYLDIAIRRREVYRGVRERYASIFDNVDVLKEMQGAGLHADMQNVEAQVDCRKEARELFDEAANIQLRLSQIKLKFDQLQKDRTRLLDQK